MKEVIWKTSQNSQINRRSSHPEVFLSKDVLKNFTKFTDKHLCQSLPFNKVAGWKPETVRSSYWRCSKGLVFVKKKHCKVNFWYQQIIHSNTDSCCEHITVVLIHIYVSVSVCWLLCVLCVICQQTSVSLISCCIKDTTGWVGRGFDNIWKRDT